MRLISVSAIPPIMHKLVTTQTEILYEGRHCGYKTSSSWEVIQDSKQVLPRILPPTNLYINKLDGTQVTQYVWGQRYYNWNDTENISEYTTLDQDLKSTLTRDLVACNLQSNIIDSWEVPDEYIEAGQRSEYTVTNATDVGGYTTLYNKLIADSIVYIPYSSYAQGVINAKTRYGQSVTVKVYNPASGASLTKRIYDALPDGTDPRLLSYVLPYRVVADIKPEGCPIFSFVYNDGGTNQLTHCTEYIKGGSWRKIQLNAEGVSGSYFEKLALNQAREELNTRTAITLAGSAAGLLAGGALMGVGGAALAGSTGIADEIVSQMAGMYGSDAQIATRYGTAARGLQSRGMYGMLGGGAGLIGGAVNYALSIQKLRHQEDMLNARCSIAVAPTVVGNSDFMKDTGNNKFYYVFTSYNGEDMRNFDTFLTRFGYNVGKMFIRNRHFYSRLKYNYVKVNDIQLVSNDQVRGYYVGKSILEKVETQLRQGVRIWRKKPDANDLLPDGNNVYNPIAYREGDV